MYNNKMKKIKNNNINVYKVLPKSLIPSYTNPSYDNHLFTLPFRCICVGASGSGKTQVIVNFIHRAKDTFNKILICLQNKDEPLYNFLSLKIDPEMLFMYEGISNIPSPEEVEELCDKDDQILMIFDDLVIEKKQKVIEEYFIRGRKICNGISCIYSTQSYYGTPKIIRLQCNYVILKKLTTIRDLKYILTDYSLNLTKEQILELYKKCTENPLDFLLIDVQTDSENRFRHNWTGVIDISSYME